MPLHTSQHPPFLFYSFLFIHSLPLPLRRGGAKLHAPPSFPPRRQRGGRGGGRRPPPDTQHRRPQRRRRRALLLLLLWLRGRLLEAAAPADEVLRDDEL